MAADLNQKRVRTHGAERASGAVLCPTGGAAGEGSLALRVIGRVVSDVTRTKEMPIGGRMAAVEVFPAYEPALHRIDEYSHLWIISFFHEADRDTLLAEPKKVDESLPAYGVFALRSPSRPNPLCLNLVQLVSRQGARLEVAGLDAIAGTPVVDIKPYNEHDTIFSVRTPGFRISDPGLRREWMRLVGLQHHQEECVWFDMALDVALLAEDELGCLQDPRLSFFLRGPACLADVLQGLTRARLANPARMRFEEARKGLIEVAFTRGARSVTYELASGLEMGEDLDDAAFSDQKWRRVEAGPAGRGVSAGVNRSGGMWLDAGGVGTNREA